MGNLDAIRGIGGSGSLRPLQAIQKREEVAGASFKETLSGFLGEVNTMQHRADQSIEKMVAGEITDIHQVVNASDEARAAFNMMMEMRNKVMEAYDEVMRMRL